MDYKLKYEKYKAKYLTLKNQHITQLGGSTKDHELYLFKADWCSHCKAFKKNWEELKNSNLKNKVKFITIDADADKKIINEWNIGGYPTVIFKNGDTAIEYNGDRSVKSINDFLNKNIKN